MKKTKSRLMSVALVCVMLLGLLPMMQLTVDAIDLRTTDDLIMEDQRNDSGTCVVYSNMYMARRRIALEDSISAAKQVAFSSFRVSATGSSSGTGVYSNFSYTAPNGITHTFTQMDLYTGDHDYTIRTLADSDVGIRNITGGNDIRTLNVSGSCDPAKLKEVLIYLLRTHEEGVVIYAYNAGVGQHAVLVTDYDASSGNFYCADPGMYSNPRRRTLTQSYLATSYVTGQNMQDDILRYVISLWYISDSSSPSGGFSSSAGSVTAPSTPMNLKASKIDNRNASVSWNAVSSATSYEVQFKRDGIDWKTDTDYAGGTSYTSTYLDYDPYYFRVRALNSAGASAWVEITYYRNGIAARPIVGRGYTTQGTAVSDLQTMLNKVIGAGLSVDGIFGDSTYNAVSTYQSRKGLTADGICGADTWAALEADYNAAATANVHSHSLAHVPAKAATEQAEGNIEYWYCSGCGKYFSNASATQEISKVQTVLAKLTHKHSLTHTAAKASTEKSVGNIEYWRCAGCGKYFSDANATKEISREQTVVTQLNHTHKLVHTAKKDATCTESGNVEYWHCSDCSKYFSDAQGKSELSSQSLLTAALGHNYVNGVCSQCGEKQNNVAKGQFGNVSLAKQTLYFQGQFADVPADQWFTSGVASAFEFGLMKGNGDGFNPYGDVTLAEAITMAARINSIYTTGGESFDQSVGNAWYQTYLDYAYQNGIISRAYYNSNVNNKATRAQFAEIFAKCLPDAALPKGNNISDDAIPDVGMSDSFAQHVYKLYRAGILTGSDANGTFSPLTYITRAEAATIVSRMADSNNRVAFSIK